MRLKKGDIVRFKATGERLKIRCAILGEPDHYWAEVTDTDGRFAGNQRDADLTRVCEDEVERTPWDMKSWWQSGPRRG